MDRESSLGLVGSSRKENEYRVPLYPEHLPWLPDGLRKRLVFETGYGVRFGFDDSHFTSSGCRILPRDQLMQRCGIVVLPKPTIDDLRELREGQTLCGWAHCVQQRDFTQMAIDRRLTVIAWESMHHWAAGDAKPLHIFYKNNELAGYCAVLHALQVVGADGHYGPRRRVCVTGYGAVSRGAIYALQGRGFNNIHVLTRRPTHLVADQNPDVYFARYYDGPEGVMVRERDGSGRSILDEFGESDIICNGVLQDTDAPILFVQSAEVDRLKPRTLIVDISCDEGMGFGFARPTTFDSPTFSVGKRCTYYSVDHTPSYLWDAASREVSRALIPYLDALCCGRDGWKSEATLERAIEVENGEIRNPRILSFQRRAPEFPHPML